MSTQELLVAIDGTEDRDFPHEDIDGDPSQSNGFSKWLRSILNQQRVHDQRPSVSFSDGHAEDLFRFARRIIWSAQWIVVPLFLLFGVAAVVLIILEFLNLVSEDWILFAILLGVNLIGGGVGSYFVYQFGTIDEHIPAMQYAVAVYARNLAKLHETIDALKRDTDQIAVETLKCEVPFCESSLQIIPRQQSDCLHSIIDCYRARFQRVYI